MYIWKYTYIYIYVYMYIHVHIYVNICIYTYIAHCILQLPCGTQRSLFCDICVHTAAPPPCSALIEYRVFKKKKRDPCKMLALLQCRSLFCDICVRTSQRDRPCHPPCSAIPFRHHPNCQRLFIRERGDQNVKKRPSIFIKRPTKETVQYWLNSTLRMPLYDSFIFVT